MSTLQEMMSQSPNGELDNLSQRALTLYRETLAVTLEPEHSGKGLAIHPDSGDYLVADNSTLAGRLMDRRHPSGVVVMRIGRQPEYALLARMNGIRSKV